VSLRVRGRQEGVYTEFSSEERKIAIFRTLDNAAKKNPFALQRHCTENWKQIFPEMKLRGLVPNSYIHVSLSHLYIPTIGQPN
jgi:hypothetical protein